jgi:hypothetical protein
MDDSIDPLVAKGASERVAVAQVGIDQGHVLSGQASQARQYRTRAVGKIVEHARRITGTGERDDYVRADVAGAAGDENCASHAVIL